MAVIYSYLVDVDNGVSAFLLDPVFSAFIVVAICILGVELTGHAEKYLGRDAGSIVWDEFAGFAITIWTIPFWTVSTIWPVMLGAFVLFRFFDVAKPPPARAAEKLPGGWGVIADDVVAGIYANLTLRALITLISHW
jgi:phosphatidylglycerophosphatase A